MYHEDTRMFYNQIGSDNIIFLKKISANRPKLMAKEDG